MFEQENSIELTQVSELAKTTGSKELITEKAILDSQSKGEVLASPTKTAEDIKFLKTELKDYIENSLIQGLKEPEKTNTINAFLKDPAINAEVFRLSKDMNLTTTKRKTLWQGNRNIQWGYDIEYGKDATTALLVMVSRNLYLSNTEINKQNILNEVSYIDKLLSQYWNIRADQNPTYYSYYSEFKEGSENAINSMENWVEKSFESKDQKEILSKIWEKYNNEEWPRTFVIETHWNPNSLNWGTTPKMIADAFIQRENTNTEPNKKDILVLSACSSSQFVRNILSEFDKAGKSDLKPIIIADAEYWMKSAVWTDSSPTFKNWSIDYTPRKVSWTKQMTTFSIWEQIHTDKIKWLWQIMIFVPDSKWQSKQIAENTDYQKQDKISKTV